MTRTKSKESDTMAALMGDPPFRHLAAQPDHLPYRRESIEDLVEALDGPAGPERPKKQPEKPRRWIIPDRRLTGEEAVTISSIGELTISKALERRWLNRDGEIWLGIAIEPEGDIVIEPCHKREPWAMRVTYRIVRGGNTLRDELRKAGWPPGTYLVEFDDAGRSGIVLHPGRTK